MDFSSAFRMTMSMIISDRARNDILFWSGLWSLRHRGFGLGLCFSVVVISVDDVTMKIHKFLSFDDVNSIRASPPFTDNFFDEAPVETST
jgi:hypothetical protein